MKIRLLAASMALVASTSAVYAVGLDRSGQPIGVLFETGNHLEFRFGYAKPSVEGEAIPQAGGAAIDNVADTFSIYSLGLKYEINDQWSVAIIGDEPYGSDVLYPGSLFSTVLGGTGATADSYAVTALARYKINDNWSVHGGLRYQEISATVTLGGSAFNSPQTPLVPSGVNGYLGEFASSGDWGYVVGAAYEIPDIALRVALTYNSGTSHKLATTETIRGQQISAPGATTSVDTPESLNLAFQSGIAENTLLFGNLRYARYSQTVVAPDGFTGITGTSLTDLEDGYDFEIGVGRRFSEKWSGSMAIGFSTKGEDSLVSPLMPTNGSKHISFGVKYDVNEQFAVSGGIRYTDLGDAISAPSGSAAATFSDNSAISVGLRLAYKF